MSSRHWILLCGVIALVWPLGAEAANPDSQAMAQRIATEIDQSGQLSNYRVGVKYENGVAWLMGSVTDSSQAAKAIAIARQIDGVDKVVNQFEIGGNPVPEQAAKPLIQKEESGGMLLSLFEDESQQPQTTNPTPRKSQKPQPQNQLRRTSSAPLQRLSRPRQTQPRMARRGMPAPMAPSRLAGVQPVSHRGAAPAQYAAAAPRPTGYPGGTVGASYENANMPGHAWPSYAAYPNYSAVTYPQQYSPTAWPYIGPFYPYPQVPLGWRKVALEWDDGWWFLDFSHHQCQ